ncbi:putative quinol oxidase subunit SoxD [Candidatus Acidianus copahuensis]|nr:hypothetical protein [Candidatus Acidianus copahuensis]KOY79891.1 putative quinol oxidase subunit SoxD [Candidatus Acidianus copahuensis]
MTRLGIAILALIFGATAALAAFITYTILWDSSTSLILPELVRSLNPIIS